MLAARTSADGPAAASLAIRIDADAHRWDAYVERAPHASVYHLAAWADVIRDAFGHPTRYLSAWAGDRLVGILPLVLFKSPLFGRFATSMPFVNYGGVVADSEAVGRALLGRAVTEAQGSGARYFELRHDRRQFGELAVKTHKVAMVLPLRASADAQWTALDRKLRNQVRKAEKSGLTVRTGGLDLLPAFHDVFVENMRDLGTPVHGPRFFERILTTFPDRTRILCVELDGRPVAASFVIWHHDRIEVPWASAIRRFNPLCPNVLLYWEMLKFGIARGLTSFDFGRSTPNEGTFHFKQQWGAEPVPLYWEYWLAAGATLPDRSPKNARFSAAIAAWQRMPLSVTRAIGPHIVRHIP